MKIKRFKNLWTMGLILTGAILVLFYIAKIFFPQFIVGVAEIPRIVKFGNYVDTHKWANHAYNLLNGFLIGYIYCCACTRTYKLSWKGILLVVLSNIVLILLSEINFQYYSAINYLNFVFYPFIICVVDKKLHKENFVSTVCCFTIDIIAQIFTMLIRDITIMTTKVNSATFAILLIDLVIWRVLLYMYFNYKNKKEV